MPGTSLNAGDIFYYPKFYSYFWGSENLVVLSELVTLYLKISKLEDLDDFSGKI